MYKFICALQPVVFVNTFSVYSSKHEQTLAYWQIARDVLAQKPAFISTRLHWTSNTDALNLT